MTGAYIKLHISEKVNYKNKWNLIVAMMSVLFIIGEVLVFDILGFVLKNDIFIAKAGNYKEYNHIIAVICAVSLFMYFVRIDFENKIINKVATTVVGIYLIHDNHIVRTYIWTMLYPNAQYVDSPYLHAVIKIFGVFIICMLIDLIRSSTVGNFFDNWFFRNCDKMIDKMVDVKCRLMKRLIKNNIN